MNAANQSYNESPKETFTRLLYKQIAPALQELHTLCKLNGAPEEVTRLFSVEFGEEASVANLIARTVGKNRPAFLD